MTHRSRTLNPAVRLVAVVAFLLGTVACGNNAPNPSSDPRSDVLQFTANLADGGEFVGTSLAGRAAVLWFWAPT